MQLTLKKDSTGAWGRQTAGSGKPRRFRAWQRLLVATGVLYLLLLIAAGFLLMPDRDHIERSMIFAVTEETKRYDGLAFAGEAPSTIFDQARNQGFQSWISQVRRKYQIDKNGDAGFAAIDRRYRQELSDLPAKRLSVVVWLLAAWLVPMLFVYLTGLLLAWIKRGNPEA
jgi:hypothetical protein